jgi:hypothetical protein
MTDAGSRRALAVLAPDLSALPAQVEYDPISESEARQLTERIRTATRHVCLLLREVHERRAWVPLGYASWEQYVQAEFSISRTRSYELLDQANVILDLRNAAGLEEVPHVSAYVALQIKPRLPLIRETLRRRLGEGDRANAVAILGEVVDEHRRQVAQSRRLAQERRVRRPRSSDLDSQDHLLEAIDLLAGIAATDAVEGLVDAIEPPQVESVESTIAWLSKLLAEWRRRHHTGAGPAGGGRRARS